MSNRYSVEELPATLGERLEVLVRAELSKEISEAAFHQGRQAILGGLYTEWANQSYRRPNQMDAEAIAAIKAHTAGMTRVQKLDAAIDIVTELFGPLDALEQTG